jgi:predicted ATP-grasp superfamily ATP-dependent carboligase
VSPEKTIQPNLTQDEIETVVEKAVKKAVANVLVSFGIEESDRREIRADFAYLRRWRKSAEQLQSYTLRAVITAIVAGGLGALWLGLKTMMGK